MITCTKHQRSTVQNMPPCPHCEVEALRERVLVFENDYQDMNARWCEEKQRADTAEDIIRSVTRDMNEWRDTAQDLRVITSRISGTLMDAGNITVDPLSEGVAELLAERNTLRALVECATAYVVNRFSVHSFQGRWSLNGMMPGGVPVCEIFDDPTSALTRARELLKGGTTR